MIHERKIRLICLPFAGVGIGFFRGWARLAGPDLDLVPMLLPGRERRISERPRTSVASALEEIQDQALACAERGDPVMLFGHSLGAVLAYELTRLLQRSGHAVDRLFVSGSMAPGDPIPAAYGAMTTGTDDEFVAALEERVGFRHEALHTAEVRPLVLPALRADVSMHADYQAAACERLPVPITALRGSRDELVSRTDMMRWSTLTTGEFDYVELEGSHMYLMDSVSEVLDVVGRHLRR
ncbi:MAG TPA: alpha/beta fold hydrolase [Mycobacteriales bacterium]|nr:alpha/beta fold hydrolase [Mycobacteriales bacterium]